jgi:uncharacterized membrane protein YfcA
MTPLIAGFLAGILSGFGIGGGTLLMLYLTVFAGIAQKTAQGINLLYFLPTAAASLILHGKNHTVNWRVVPFAVLGGCVTAGLFSYAAILIDLNLLKKLFGGFLVLTGLSELLRKSS